MRLDFNHVTRNMGQFQSAPFLPGLPNLFNMRPAEKFPRKKRKKEAKVPETEEKPLKEKKPPEAETIKEAAKTPKAPETEKKTEKTAESREPSINLQQAVLWSEILGKPVSKQRRKKRMEQRYGNQGYACRR